MIDTSEYYGGLYPDHPYEVIDEEPDNLGWDLDYADEYHELMMIGEIK